MEPTRRRLNAGGAGSVRDCIGLLYAEPAEQPAYSTVTYYVAVCGRCHEECVIVNRYKGKIVADPSALEVPDITTARAEEL